MAQVRTSDSQEIRASAVLTASFVASTDVGIESCAAVMVHIDFTKGSLTDVDIRFEVADVKEPDSDDWREVTDADGAVIELTYTADANVAYTVKDLAAKRFRVKALGGGTVTGSLLGLKATRRETL